MGNLRRQNANEATGTFNRSRNVAPILGFAQGLTVVKGM